MNSKNITLHFLVDLNGEVCHHLFPLYHCHKKLFDLIERAFPTAFLTTYDMKMGAWQGARKSLHAGLPFKAQSVETVVASMAEKATALGYHSNSQRITNRPTLSVFYGTNNFMKGTSTCKKNFSGHSQYQSYLLEFLGH